MQTQRLVAPTSLQQRVDPDGHTDGHVDRNMRPTTRFPTGGRTSGE